LAALEQTGSVTESASAAKVGRITAYDTRRADPLFAAAWDRKRSTQSLPRRLLRPFWWDFCIRG